MTTRPTYEELERRVRELETSEHRRKEAEEAHQECERRLRLSQQIARIGHVDYRLETGDVYWSEMMYQFYEREPSLGPPSYEEVMALHPPDDADSLRRVVAEAARNGTPYSVDVGVRLPSGRSAVYHAIGVPQEDEGGRVINIAGTVQDVTDRRRAEQAVEREKALFHGTFENAAVGIVHVAPDGRLIRVNQKMCDITGYGRDELQGKSFQEITHPEDLQRDLEWTDRLVRGEIDQYHLEKRYVREGGDTVWIRLTASMINEEVGVGIIEDISERKTIQSALEEQEERLRTIVENSRDGIHQLDLRSGAYVFMSPAQENLTGFTLEDLNRLTMKKASARLHPDDVPVVEAFFEQVAQGRVPEAPMEYRWRVKGGGYRWFSDSREAIRDDSGTIVSLIGVSRDITRQKQMEEELRRSRDELELRVEERTAELKAESRRRRYLAKRLVDILEGDRQALAMMLHEDVGQRLAGMKITLENLQNTLRRKDPSLAESLDFTVGSLREIIVFLRDTSRQLRPGSLDVLGLVPALRTLGDGIQTQACKIHFFFKHVPESLDRGLEIAVFRIAQEAVTNALRHAGCGELHLSLKGLGDRLYLIVEDDGCGFSWDETFSEPSNALGLVIMRERAAHAGGELRVESFPGKGTTVMAEFPLKAPVEEVVQP